MDQKTYLKEMAKHAQRNTTNTKREDSNQKKVQVKFIKEESIFDQIDVESLALFREMMADRYRSLHDD
ncbi:hypothetical protein OAB61_00375 [bacterium]|nr:hypothetical protein [bacterium]